MQTLATLANHQSSGPALSHAPNKPLLPEQLLSQRGLDESLSFIVDPSESALHTKYSMAPQDITVETLPQLLFSEHFRRKLETNSTDESLEEDPSSQMPSCDAEAENQCDLAQKKSLVAKDFGQSDENFIKSSICDVSLSQDPLSVANNDTPKHLQILNHPLIKIDNHERIVNFFRDFLTPNRVWTLQSFMESLDTMYELTRVRFTKGGHKTNQDHKMRQSFICQCHGRGSHSRQAVFRKRDHYFSQSSCRARISIRQLLVSEQADGCTTQATSSNDRWTLDRSELQHNHEPQSIAFYQSQRQKEITEAQRHFITDAFRRNNKINGAEVRRLYKLRFPSEGEMFGKKVQNLIQILRLGKSITKGDEFQLVSAMPTRLRKSDVASSQQQGQLVADHDSQFLDGDSTTLASSLPNSLDNLGPSLISGHSQNEADSSVLKTKSQSEPLKVVAPPTDVTSDVDRVVRQLAETSSPIIGISFNEFKSQLNHCLQQDRLTPGLLNMISTTPPAAPSQNGVFKKRELKMMDKGLPVINSPLIQPVSFASVLTQPRTTSDKSPQQFVPAPVLGPNYNRILLPTQRSPVAPELPRYLEDLIKSRSLSQLQSRPPLPNLNRALGAPVKAPTTSLLQNIQNIWGQSKAALARQNSDF